MTYLLLLYIFTTAVLLFVALVLWIVKGYWKAMAKYAQHQLALANKRCEDIEVENIRMLNRELGKAAPRTEWPEILER